MKGNGNLPNQMAIYMVLTVRRCVPNGQRAKRQKIAYNNCVHIEPQTHSIVFGGSKFVLFVFVCVYVVFMQRIGNVYSLAGIKEPVQMHARIKRMHIFVSVFAYIEMTFKWHMTPY